MAVYVDDAFIPATVMYRGRPLRSRWCHLTADTDEELHAFAASIGLRREWFQPNERRPEANHYDVTVERRHRAIKAGAIEETTANGSVRRRAMAARRRGY